MEFVYRFPAVKGLQAKREYYIGLVPLRMITKLFPNGEEYVLPEYRAQRRINENRIPEIKNYILNNEDNYVFSALAASIDGKYKFLESNQDNIGILEVSMDSKFLINDGQHRKAAIIEALAERPELGDETIAVVFFADKGLKRSQQMFTDLNKHAVKTSNSIAELYDSRDILAVCVRNVISKISFLDEYVDKERDILGKFSSSLFTLNTFYVASKRILHRKKCTPEFEDFLYRFWKSVVENMTPWQDLAKKELSKKELRELYVATQAIIIQAFGRVGCYMCEKSIVNVDSILKRLVNINWKRNSKQWKLRVIRNDGRIINNETAIILAGNYIKTNLGFALSEDERRVEKTILR